MANFSFDPRKKPRQARSEATVAAILGGATRVLASHGLEGFNTNRVAEAAGVSVGSLYQYFPNKDALAAALIVRSQAALADGLEGLIAALVGRTLVESVRQLAILAVAQQYGEARLAAALDYEERRLPVPEIAAARSRMITAVEQLLARHSSELAPGLSASRASDCLTLAQALVEADAWADRSPSRDLTERVARALIGYLTVPV